MCGPLATAACGHARTPWASTRYHAGRVLGYVAGGSLAGLLGARLAKQLPAVGILPAVSALVLALMAFKLWRQSARPALAPAAELIPAAQLTRTSRVRRGAAWLREPLVLGTLSALLPCGALMGAWLLAAMTGSARQGASFMAGFVLTSGVAVAASAWLLRRVAGVRRPALARGGAALLLLVAMLTLTPLLSSSLARSTPGQPRATLRCH